LKLNARIFQAAEQGLHKNRLKIEIFIKTFSYYVKFEERKKNQWALEKYFSCAAAGLWKKVWYTAMADNATDLEMFVLPQIGAAIEKIC